MLSIHLTPTDVGRVRLAGGPDAVLDTMLAARALRDAVPTGPLRRWRREARSRLDTSMRPLFHLVSGNGFPDFLTPVLDGPTGRSAELTAGLRAIVDTPVDDLRRELEPRGDALTSWTRRLMTGDGQARAELGHAVRHFHRAVVHDREPQLDQWFDAARSVGFAALAESGVDGLLSTLHPDISWDSLTLSALGSQATGQVFEVHLGGRGLDLYPSPLTADPMIAALPGRPALLVVPSAHLLSQTHVASGADRPDRADRSTGTLADLLGRTRAELLVSLTVPGTTSQMARRLGVAASSVSEHAGVLRRAGLVVSQRRSGTVLHSLTGLGHRLVRDSFVERAPARATS